MAGVLGPSVGGISGRFPCLLRPDESVGAFRIPGGIRAAATWDQLVQSYRPQASRHQPNLRAFPMQMPVHPFEVQGLVEGGVHLLMLDMVSDTLNAKARGCSSSIGSPPPSCQAAVYVIEEYFSMNPKDRLPVVINVTMKAGSVSAGVPPGP